MNISSHSNESITSNRRPTSSIPPSRSNIKSPKKKPYQSSHQKGMLSGINSMKSKKESENLKAVERMRDKNLSCVSKNDKWDKITRMNMFKSQSVRRKKLLKVNESNNANRLKKLRINTRNASRVTQERVAKENRFQELQGKRALTWERVDRETVEKCNEDNERMIRMVDARKDHESRVENRRKAAFDIDDTNAFDSKVMLNKIDNDRCAINERRIENIKLIEAREMEKMEQDELDYHSKKIELMKEKVKKGKDDTNKIKTSTQTAASVNLTALKLQMKRNQNIEKLGSERNEKSRIDEINRRDNDNNQSRLNQFMNNPLSSLFTRGKNVDNTTIANALGIAKKRDDNIKRLEGLRVNNECDRLVDNRSSSSSSSSPPKTNANTNHEDEISIKRQCSKSKLLLKLQTPSSCTRAYSTSTATFTTPYNTKNGLMHTPGIPGLVSPQPKQVPRHLPPPLDLRTPLQMPFELGSGTHTPIHRSYSFTYTPFKPPSMQEYDSMSSLKKTYTQLRLVNGEDEGIARMRGLIDGATG